MIEYFHYRGFGIEIGFGAGNIYDENGFLFDQITGKSFSEIRENAKKIIDDTLKEDQIFWGKIIEISKMIEATDSMDGAGI